MEEVKIGNTFVSKIGCYHEEVICLEKPIEDKKHCKNCIYYKYGYSPNSNVCNQLKCFAFERKDKKDIIFKEL